jgi:hypothetical protein
MIGWGEELTRRIERSTVALAALRNRLLVDRISLTHLDCPIIAVDLLDEPGRTSRVISVAIQDVENGLSISNMDFSEFVDNADQGGIFRGFPES